MVDGLRLAALVGSKVCHEIVGPMTGILHGLELLKESDIGGRNAEALALLEQGLHKVAAKVDFLRGTFAPNEGEALISLSEARRLGEPLFASLKPDLAWRAPDISLPRTALRVFMNLLLLSADCLPRGGVVAVEAEESRVLEVRAVATGPRASLRAAVAGALHGDPTEGGVQADLVVPLMTLLLARQAGYTLLTRTAPERIELVLQTPGRA